MKDEKTKSTIEVSGMETFRRVTILTTLVASCISVIIVAVGPRECDTNDQLRDGVIITFSV